MCLGDREHSSGPQCRSGFISLSIHSTLGKLYNDCFGTNDYLLPALWLNDQVLHTCLPSPLSVQWNPIADSGGWETGSSPVRAFIKVTCEGDMRSLYLGPPSYRLYLKDAVHFRFEFRCLTVSLSVSISFSFTLSLSFYSHDMFVLVFCISWCVHQGASIGPCMT